MTRPEAAILAGNVPISFIRSARWYIHIRMSVSFTKYIPAAYCLLVSTDWLRLVGRDVAHISMKAITITAGDLLVTRSR